MAKNQESIQKLRELIKDIDMAMLTTVDEDGSLRSRPMATHQVEFDGTLWFFTYDNTAKVEEIQHEREVNVSYMSASNNTYVSMTGTAIIVKDYEKMKELWNPIYKAWFTEGLDDPHLALMKIDVDRAEYWQPDTNNRFVEMVHILKAAVTGEHHEGINEKINLKR